MEEQNNTQTQTKTSSPAEGQDSTKGRDVPERNVFISSNALVRTYGGDGETDIVKEEMVPRNTYTLVERLKTYDPGSVVGIYLVEDEEKSDPPEDGHRYAIPLLPKEEGDGEDGRMTVVDAMARLVAATTPDNVAIAKLHQLCDHSSATTHYDCGVYTMVFGGKPCGFAYLNSCRDVPVSSLALLYETAKSQVASLKEQLRAIAPGIRFSDDPEPVVTGGSGIVLPSGAPADGPGAHPSGASSVITPNEGGGVAQAHLVPVVHIVD